MKSLSFQSYAQTRNGQFCFRLSEFVCVYVCVCVFFVFSEFFCSAWAHKLLEMLGYSMFKLLGLLLIISPQFRDVTNHLTSN
jgi:uncharacterized membrane protein